jgi:hypothetical protein
VATTSPSTTYVSSLRSGASTKSSTTTRGVTWTQTDSPGWIVSGFEARRRRRRFIPLCRRSPPPVARNRRREDRSHRRVEDRLRAVGELDDGAEIGDGGLRVAPRRSVPNGPEPVAREFDRVEKMPSDGLEASSPPSVGGGGRPPEGSGDAEEVSDGLDGDWLVAAREQSVHQRRYRRFK